MLAPLRQATRPSTVSLTASLDFIQACVQIVTARLCEAKPVAKQSAVLQRTQKEKKITSMNFACNMRWNVHCVLGNSYIDMGMV